MSYENQDTIHEVTARTQELQNEVQYTVDNSTLPVNRRQFQLIVILAKRDAQSVRSGNSHVTSQPVSFPPLPIPGGMLSRPR